MGRAELRAGLVGRQGREGCGLGEVAGRVEWRAGSDGGQGVGGQLFFG